jgi:hypothetical protein
MSKWIKQLSEEEIQTANKYMKKCVTALARKEMQIKMTQTLYTHMNKRNKILKNKHNWQ